MSTPEVHSGGGAGAPDEQPGLRDPWGDAAPGENGAVPSARGAGGQRRGRLSLPVAAAAGLASGLLAVGVADLVAAFTGPSSEPLVAVGDAFVDRTPPWLKNAAISAFGTHDKQVLLTGAALVLAALCALAGILAARGPFPGAYVVLALGAVAGLAAATRPDATVLSVLPSAIAAILGAIVLSGVVDRLEMATASSGGGGPGRRAMLRTVGVVAGSGLVALAGGRLFSRATGDAETSRSVVRLPPPARPEPALPAGVDVRVPGVAPFRVPNADFYRIDTALVVPQVRAQSWRLRIHGLVAREVTLDFPTLLASPLVERDVTLCCVSNEVGGDLIGNATWLGLPIGPLLRQAGPHPEADMVLSTSADGFTCSTPLAALTDGRDALLAVGMNGAPLPVEHGFPVRMVVPGLYGYVSATKWVVDLEVTRFDRATAYWTPRGWSAQAPIKTESRIDVPKDGASIAGGRVAVAGVAWAQHRGVEGVEVRIDGGPWQRAQLGAEASIDTWRQWVYWWDAPAGQHTLQARATDRTGVPQTGVNTPPPPNGATGWHTITVQVT
jgi:DMSO/TMAO reductase YedYZ molybdopterin-dependent catalytic subunit